MTIEQMYTVQEVAEMFRVTPATIRAWIRGKKLRAVRIGYTSRIPASAIAELGQ